MGLQKLKVVGALEAECTAPRATAQKPRSPPGLLPEDCGGPEVNDLVKRVIGLPGETISTSGGYVYIDGKRLNETWLPASKQGTTGEGPPGSPSNLDRPFHIPANDYFVMGDNRTDSCDSRYWGPIARSLIVGKVEFRVWPLSALHIF